MKQLALIAAAPLLLAMQAPETPQSPAEIVAATTEEDWRPILPENLLIMTLGDGGEVLIELAPGFAPIHVANIRRLAREGWYDGISINRVQDNYVVQWGDASGNKPLPEGIERDPPEEYDFAMGDTYLAEFVNVQDGHYEQYSGYLSGWPVGHSPREDGVRSGTLVHCYGMVGVGRGDNPDTGTGAELYTVIGHAPRHLDRNIALVGRVIEGIEHLSSLPRGTGPLGFYEGPGERVPIASVRLASELEEAAQPRFEVMRTDSAAFRAYVDARANRTGWFIRPAGAVDVCNVNLPIRRAAAD
ncbi:peptidylprolyl isomerase [Parasphingopyxis sp.]|uniref:peptidylprolyl isomerase n=1 Tax=Parasphingopyxis sp. TaxID=1920299 RepID=UPI0026323D86|nr:peptidylprolyl isomerase [Parasphingopyxis sp.]